MKPTKKIFLHHYPSHVKKGGHTPTARAPAALASLL
jgi:hypothetical protein